MRRKIVVGTAIVLIVFGALGQIGKSTSTGSALATASAVTPLAAPVAAHAVAAAGADVADNCQIQAARSLGPGSADDWSHQSNLIASARLDDSGVYQMHMLKPDGSDDVCLTCSAHGGGPPSDRHKIDANWHPDGQHLVMQAEMANHPISLVHTLGIISEFIANGLWSNLYVTTADAQQWWRLTDYSTSQADGAMAPFFSSDGTKLLWSRMVAPASDQASFGQYRLMLADYAVDAAGNPSVQNVRDITPDGAKFIEAHGFSPDGSKALFASDIGLDSVWSMDIWTVDVATGALSNLTHSPTYEEHATFSLSGDKLVYMSSSPYPGTFLQADLMVAAPDGSGKRQLTFFNVPGHPESTKAPVMPVWMSWNADGTAMAVTLQLGGLDYPKRQLWVLEFAGPCGG